MVQKIVASMIDTEGVPFGQNLLAASDGAIWQSPALIGTYNVADLPSAADNAGKFAYVPDLGGGADFTKSDGTSWKHINRGVPSKTAIASTISVTPLYTAPQLIMTGSNFLNSSAIKVQPQNLYQGYELTVVLPAGVLGLTGTLGVGLNVGGLLPMLGGTWADYSYDGTSFVKIRGGNL